MTVDDGISNPSTNRPFQDVLATNLSRRKALIGGSATAAIAFFGASTVAEAGTAPAKGGNGNGHGKGRQHGRFLDSLIGFAACPNPGGPNPTISDDYQYDIIIPWGSPLQPGGPDIEPPGIAVGGGPRKVEREEVSRAGEGCHVRGQRGNP